MAFGGSNENPIVMPKDHSGGPPLRVPDQPPSGSRMFWERVVKWVGIVLVAVFMVLFVYLVINGSEDYSENGLSDEQIATLDARRG